METQVVEYIRSAQRGDHLAFNRLVSLYDERISRLILSIVVNQKDAEDLYQDIFIKIWKKLNSYKFKSEFYSWMYRIAVNTCINYNHRMKKNRWENIATAEQYYTETPSPFDDDRNAQILQIMRRLPHRQRTIAVMFYLENNTVSIISKITKITEGTIKRYLFRIRETIQMELSIDG